MLPKNHEDYEIYEIFRDQFINNRAQIKRGIVDLGGAKTYDVAVNTLFRIFHGLKANSRHFHFDPIIAFADKAEKMLSALRECAGPAEENIVEWFEKAYEQYGIWGDEMEEGASAFSQANPWLFQAGLIEQSHETLPSVLKKRSLVYFDTKKDRVNEISFQLLPIVKSVKIAASFAALEKILAEEMPDICVVNVGENCVQASRLYLKYIPNRAFIAVVDKTEKQTILKLGLKEIYHILKAPLVLEDLFRELLVVADSHFTSRRCLIDNKKIQDFIATLKPLSSTILQIQQVCNNPELSIKDLIKVVKQDSIITGQILRAANNPLYGLKEISSIDGAVTIFGMKRVQAIALSHMADAFKSVDLGAYRSNETIFSSVSALRLTLMMQWYSKVSIEALSVLSITAILGNIGELLIAQEITRLGKKDAFVKLVDAEGIQIAEEKIMHTTTASVSSDILYYWKLEKDIVDAVRFSDHPKNAPQEIVNLALANHIVYRLVKLDGTVEHSIPVQFVKVLEKRGMKVEHLQKALQNVLELL